MELNNFTVKVLETYYYVGADNNECLTTKKGKDYNVIIVPFRSVETSPLEILVTASFTEAEKSVLAQYKVQELMSNTALAPFVMRRHSDNQALMFVAESLAHKGLQSVEDDEIISEVYDSIYKGIGLMLRYWGFEEVVMPVLGVSGTRGLPTKLMSAIAISNIDYFLSNHLVDGTVAHFYILVDNLRSKEILVDAINTRVRMKLEWFKATHGNEEDFADSSTGDTHIDFDFEDFDLDLEPKCGCTKNNFATHECATGACKCTHNQVVELPEYMFDCVTCPKKELIEYITEGVYFDAEVFATTEAITERLADVELPVKCLDCPFHLAFVSRDIKKNNDADGNKTKHLSKEELENLKKRPCIKVHPPSDDHPDGDFTTLETCQKCTENCIFKGTWTTFEQFKM